ncbi:MAG: MMPL family transporter, partial [Planctomycetota bacterium]
MSDSTTATESSPARDGTPGRWHRLAERFAEWVIRRSVWIILAWLIIAVVLRLLAPSWKDVAYDGDFDYLPSHLNSVQGRAVLDAAFPTQRSRSQLVVLIGRSEEKFKRDDQLVAWDLSRRLHHIVAVTTIRRLMDTGWDGGLPIEGTEQRRLVNNARQALDEAIAIDGRFFAALKKLKKEQNDDGPPRSLQVAQPRLTMAYWDRSVFLQKIGETDAALIDQEAALVLNPDLEKPGVAVPLADRALDSWQPVIDVLGWEDPALGPNLRSPHAAMILLRLQSDLAAVQNIELLQSLRGVIRDARENSGGIAEPGLDIMPTGSAAVGAEVLMASRDAIQYTELLTIAMILIILACVYRAPLLVFVPLVSIFIAVAASVGGVGLLALLSQKQPQLIDVRVFTTSRIFVVVILFGAGTDYCLFLIARLREEVARGLEWRQACQRSLSRVCDALVGSAMTTVLGLAMLWFGSFGKYHYTGPIIALCLLVGLAVCTTLTPALLYRIGPLVFWPTKPYERQPVAGQLAAISGSMTGSPPASGFWGGLSLSLTRYAWVWMILGFVVLTLPAFFGFQHERDVDYNLSDQLPSHVDSRRGLRFLDRHFSIAETSPVTVVFVLPSATPRQEMTQQIDQLTRQLYQRPGVVAVRHASDPLGDFPPDRESSVLTGDGMRREFLRRHRITQNYFFSNVPQYTDRLLRIDVVMKNDPFSVQATEDVQRLHDWFREQTSQTTSFFHSAEVYLTGTTPAIMDLKIATLRDNRMIKTAVVV